MTIKHVNGYEYAGVVYPTKKQAREAESQTLLTELMTSWKAKWPGLDTDTARKLLLDNPEAVITALTPISRLVKAEAAAAKSKADAEAKANAENAAGTTEQTEQATDPVATTATDEQQVVEQIAA